MQVMCDSHQIQICPFDPQYQLQIEQLVLPIQQIEFKVSITRDEQPDLVDIAGVFQHGKGNFWVALHEEHVVGCVGVMDIGSDQVALRKMFVHRDFRGKDLGVSAKLMATAKDWCRQQGVQEILLGTTAKMFAAHRFYEKHGFEPLERSELPSNFPQVHVDSKFYRCTL